MINIRVVNRKDPRKPEEAGLYYGSVVSFDKVGVDELSKLISANCTVTRSDCLAVISALQEQIQTALLGGKRVNLGYLGNFHLTCNGEGTLTAKEYTCNNIRKLRVAFIPGKQLKNALRVGNGDVKFFNLYEEKENEEPDAAV